MIATVRPDRLPVPLRRVARFEPRRRAKLAATPIATHLEGDGDFRELVAETVREARPELADAVEAGTPPAAADPVEVAALAYLLRPPGWTAQVEAARQDLDRAAAVAEKVAAAQQVAQLRDQLAAARSTRTEEIEALRASLRDVRAENAELRRKLHEARGRAKSAAARAEETERRAEGERAVAADAVAGAEKELKRLRARLAQAEAASEKARRAAREGRSAGEARLRVLLDALGDAAKGLRDELGLPVGIAKPADTVAGTYPGADHRPLPARSLSDNDPALLDRLLTLPQMHLIVDGYNVTKTGYGDLPLADQRTRLMSGLGGLYAQTRAEITVVFDGADLDAPVAVQAPRGVRVLFSAPGQTADELIGRLVRAEPPGRAVVVISSDQEVCDSARRANARPAPSALLLRRLGRS